jgi:hypothetical protein
VNHNPSRAFKRPFMTSGLLFSLTLGIGYTAWTPSDNFP